MNNSLAREAIDAFTGPQPLNQTQNMASDPLIDASMIYLHETKLEDAVSSALVTVVNERAKHPRERMAELLLSSGNGKSVVTSKAHRELELRVAVLESEKAALQKLREKDVRFTPTSRQATVLLAENEQLSSRARCWRSAARSSSAGCARRSAAPSA